MESKKSNKIRDIVRLQQILKKWKKLANASKSDNSNSNNNNNVGSCNKSINKFLKKTLSLSDLGSISGTNEAPPPPKGFLAVCVGKELKRFVIPTEYLGHRAFHALLREAEEEFGFQQEGVLKIPCEVPVFENILEMVRDKREVFFFHREDFGIATNGSGTDCYCSSDSCEVTHSPHPQMCR